ncbi:MAG: hybrid sensor histidine kinase/response regulator [Acidimicrobiia bacterium]
MNGPGTTSIWVIDDDPQSLLLVQQILRLAGHQNVRVFSRVTEMLKLFDPVAVDLVIQDLHMPSVDGFELLRDLRQRVPEGMFLPILVVTGDSEMESRRESLSLGATDFLTKPFDVTELTLRVSHLLEIRSLHSALRQSQSQLEADVEKRTEELADANVRLENLLQTKDVFLASVSHELRTPLTSVLGFAELLADRMREQSDVEAADLAEVVAGQAKEMAAIIEDLLVAARSDGNLVNVLSERVDLGVELHAVVSALPAASRDRITLPYGDAQALGDHLRVRQVLRNLLTNAVKYGGPSIWVEIWEGANVTGLRVVDDGAGIPEDAVEHLFEPYFHGAGDPNQPSTLGLGLTVSRLLARLMGGDLDLRPHHMGTCFQVSLPRLISQG